jgi:hypothetical protein
MHGRYAAECKMITNKQTDHPLFTAREALPYYLQTQLSTPPVDILRARAVLLAISHHSRPGYLVSQLQKPRLAHAKVSGVPG